MGTLHNDFSSETRHLFLYNHECWSCGRNKPDAGHHIVGRGLGDSVVETSPLNFAPIHNYPCHIGKSFSDGLTGYFLCKTKRYLQQHCKYKLQAKDEAFLAKYQWLYKLGEQYAEENLLLI